MLNSIATESRIKPHGADGAGKKRARGVDVAKGERDVDNNGITNFSRYEINRNVYQRGVQRENAQAESDVTSDGGEIVLARAFSLLWQ